MLVLASISKNCMGGVMVRLLVLIAVERGFEPWLGQSNVYKIGICCFSAKHTCGIKEKEQRLVGSASE